MLSLTEWLHFQDTKENHHDTSIHTYQNGQNKTMLTPSAGEDAEQLDHSHIADRNIEWNTATLENSVALL